MSTEPRDSQAPERPEMDDAPPLLGSWRNIYALVLGVLAVIVIVGAAVTRVYA